MNQKTTKSRTIRAAMMLFVPVITTVSALAEEVPAITATQTELILALPSRPASTGAVAVYELAPNEADGSWRNKAPFLVRDPGGDRSIVFTFPRFEGTGADGRDRIYSKFVVAPAGSRQATPLMSARFIQNMREATRRRFPFPRARSKKGLQVQVIDDAISLGVQHAAINVLVPTLIALRPEPDHIVYRMDGQSFSFNRKMVLALDRRIKALSDAGVIISLVLLNRQGTGSGEAERIMRHPLYDPSCPYRYSAFNTVTDEGLRYFKAAMEFIVDRYTQTDQQFGQALNLIIGNEVNSHWWWTNMGEVSMEEYVEDYLRTVRVAATAAGKICSAARVYISLDHHWTVAFGDNDKRAFPARPFIDRFARRAREQGDFAWNLAYHSYPENLWMPATWSDKTATDTFDTPKVTFKNLEVLPAYFQLPALRYKGGQRHIILSEQGFHAPDNQEGEVLQAAAYCYAYRKVADIDGIDSFIYYRHVDAKGEAGLNLGLWTREEASYSDPERKRRIYDVFRSADTPKWEEAFEFAKPIIGIGDWSEILPGSGNSQDKDPGLRGSQ